MTFDIKHAIAAMPTLNGASDIELLRPVYPELSYLFDRIEEEREEVKDIGGTVAEFDDLKDDFNKINDTLKEVQARTEQLEALMEVILKLHAAKPIKDLLHDLSTRITSIREDVVYPAIREDM